LKKNPHLQCFVFHFVLKKFAHCLNMFVSLIFFQRKIHTHNTTILNSKRITLFLMMYILFLFSCLKCLLWRTEVA
jgi:hypothetical protein